MVWKEKKKHSEVISGKIKSPLLHSITYKTAESNYKHKLPFFFPSQVSDIYNPVVLMAEHNLWKEFDKFL